MLEKEFQYYLDNQKELLKKYRGKFIVIIGENVIGSYDTRLEAYTKTLESHIKLGTFLIQQCTSGDNAYTQTFHSNRVSFA